MLPNHAVSDDRKYRVVLWKRIKFQRVNFIIAQRFFSAWAFCFSYCKNHEDQTCSAKEVELHLILCTMFSAHKNQLLYSKFAFFKSI